MLRQALTECWVALRLPLRCLVVKAQFTATSPRNGRQSALEKVAMRSVQSIRKVIGRGGSQCQRLLPFELCLVLSTICSWRLPRMINWCSVKRVRARSRRRCGHHSHTSKNTRQRKPWTDWTRGVGFCMSTKPKKKINPEWKRLGPESDVKFICNAHCTYSGHKIIVRKRKKTDGPLLATQSNEH